MSLRPAPRKEWNTSLAASIGDLAASGCRRLVVTGVSADDGSSSVAAEAGRALARTGGESVLLVDANQEDPSLRRTFGLGGRRGLAELIDEVYLLDPTQEDPLQFGLGDWIAILKAQRRTGELRVQEDGKTWVLRIVKGSVHSITGPADANARRLGDVLVERGRITASQNEEAARIQQESGRPYGEVLRALGWTAPEDLRAALTEQVRDRLTGLIALRLPESRFTEMVEPHRPASGGRAAGASDGIVDELLAGPMHEYFKRPYLSSQIPSYFSDTEIPNLKVLTAGKSDVDLLAPREREALGHLLEHLGRIFDVVLIAAPPVVRGGATAAFAPRADGVLLVVRANATEAPAVRQAAEELRRQDANVIGLVLNETAGDDAATEIPWEVLNHDHANPA